MTRYWFGALEIQHPSRPGFKRIPGVWQALVPGSKYYRPVNLVPGFFYGPEPSGQYREFETSPENFVDFLPQYFSQKVLAFLLARGACVNGAYCWAALPPVFLAWEVLGPCRDKELYKHEHKFFGALQRKWPGKFTFSYAELETRPPLWLLKWPASDLGL